MNKLRSGISCFIFICIVQAFYYPFLLSPGQQIEWWQIGPLAGAGLVIGYPVFYFIEQLEFRFYFGGLPYFVAAFLYAIIIYYFLGLGAKLLKK